MKILAFAYKKGVGKDTAAGFLQTHLRCEYPGLKIKRVSFAEKLKDITFQLYGWAGLKRGVYYENHRNEKEVTLPLLRKSPRDIWIEVGNAMRRTYPRTWIDFALKGIKVDIIIVTDVRFANEAEAVLQERGFLFKLTRDGLPQGTDPAETELDSWDDWNEVIPNNGTLKELNNTIVRLSKDYI